MTIDKKVTPVYDVTWFIKWASTFVLIVGSFLNAQNMYPINVYVMMVGVTGWFTVGCLLSDIVRVYHRRFTRLLLAL